MAMYKTVSKCLDKNYLVSVKDGQKLLQLHVKHLCFLQQAKSSMYENFQSYL